MTDISCCRPHHFCHPVKVGRQMALPLDPHMQMEMGHLNVAVKPVWEAEGYSLDQVQNHLPAQQDQLNPQGSSKASQTSQASKVTIRTESKSLFLMSFTF